MPTNDVQQARHLAQQDGWYIVSGTRGDMHCKENGVKYGEYMLVTTREAYPSYKKIKRKEVLSANNFEELKEIYGHRCVTCGSKEGEPCYLYPETITQLQQGHKDPNKQLTIDNTIPQCQFCNRASRDYFVFDNKGRGEKINNPKFVLKSSKDVQVEMLKELIFNNKREAVDIIKNIDLF